MRLVAAVIASLGVIAIAACATPTEAGRREEASKNSAPMIGLDGKDPIFAAAATRTFPYGRTRCYEAVLATLGNTRGGKAAAIARADPVVGTVVSNKMVINRGTTSDSPGRTNEWSASNQFYVQVSGSDASCAVTVTKMRVWYRDAEVETRLQSWVEWQLRGLMKGVQEEAAEPSMPEYPTAPGPGT